MFVTILTIIFLISIFSEKSDKVRMEEASKLPSFTKNEAINYYNQHLKK